MLIATTMNAAAKVVLSAPTASGFERDVQKPSVPAFFVSQRSAASGRRTMTKRYVMTAPSERAVVALPRAVILRDFRTNSAAILRDFRSNSAAILRDFRTNSAAIALTGRSSNGLFDLD